MTTLNSRQQHSYRIAKQLARFLRKSKRIYNNVTPFRNKVEDLLSHLESISQQAAIKARKGTAITARKKDLKKEIARDAADICTLAAAYALDTSNTTLLSKISKSYTHLYTTQDVLLYPGMLCITHAIAPYLDKENFQDYGITAATLASVTGKAKQFRQMMSSGKWINRESDYASRHITATLKKVKTNIRQLNRLLILFKDTNPGFIQHFHQALITTQTTKARNTLEGTITDSNTGQLIDGVTITLEGTNKTATTNLSGFYHLPGLKAGTQKMIITAEGYTPVTTDVKIIRGKTTTQNIHLNAVSLSLPKAGVA